MDEARQCPSCYQFTSSYPSGQPGEEVCNRCGRPSLATSWRVVRVPAKVSEPEPKKPEAPLPQTASAPAPEPAKPFVMSLEQQACHKVLASKPGVYMGFGEVYSLACKINLYDKHVPGGAGRFRRALRELFEAGVPWLVKEQDDVKQGSAPRYAHRAKPLLVVEEHDGWLTGGER